MIALANWAKGAADVTLTIDWKALGLDPANVRITAPEIAGLQEGRTFRVADRIPLEPGKGGCSSCSRHVTRTPVWSVYPEWESHGHDK